MPEQIMSSSKQCPIFIEMTLLTRLTESLLVNRNVVRLNILIKKKIYSKICSTAELHLLDNKSNKHIQKRHNNYY